jgi:hypothetical protein
LLCKAKCDLKIGRIFLRLPVCEDAQDLPDTKKPEPNNVRPVPAKRRYSVVAYFTSPTFVISEFLFKETKAQQDSCVAGPA